MHLVLDANEYILGIAFPRKLSCETLLNKLVAQSDKHLLSICRPLLKEVEKHLLPIHKQALYVFLDAMGTEIYETWAIPYEFVERFAEKGLKRGDAFIAGYAEWIGADILISENRKDIVDHPELFPFKVMTAEDFLKRHP